MASSTHKIAFIGGGKITKAMVGSILKSNVYKTSHIIVNDKNQHKNLLFENKWNIHTTTNNLHAATNANVIMLAVKPQSIHTVFQNLKGIQNKVILSVIAGIPLSVYQQHLKGNKIVRIMTNTPCTIQKGMTTWCTTGIDNSEHQIVQRLLQTFGQEMFVENEQFIDTATALVGTGPMYTYLLVESMIDTGIQMGLSREQAKQLVYQTVLGSIQYMIETNTHPAILRNDITSPGGTSADALYVLEKNKFRTTLADAIWAAYNKSQHIANTQSKR